MSKLKYFLFDLNLIICDNGLFFFIIIAKILLKLISHFTRFANLVVIYNQLDYFKTFMA